MRRTLRELVGAKRQRVALPSLIPALRGAGMRRLRARRSVAAEKCARVKRERYGYACAYAFTVFATMLLSACLRAPLMVRQLTVFAAQRRYAMAQDEMRYAGCYAKTFVARVAPRLYVLTLRTRKEAVPPIQRCVPEVPATDTLRRAASPYVPMFTYNAAFAERARAARYADAKTQQRVTPMRASLPCDATASA